MKSFEDAQQAHHGFLAVLIIDICVRSAIRPEWNGLYGGQ
jgi:hypothetical protein